MSALSMVLSRAGADPVAVGCGAAFDFRALDLGWPTVRAVTEDVTGADGTIDRTEYFGARALTATIYSRAATWAQRQALRGYLAPEARSTALLSGLPGGAPTLRADIRGAAASSPTRQIDVFRGSELIMCQWVIPTGIWESDTLHEVDIMPAGSGGVPGRTYPLTFPRTYPAAPVAGSRVIVNAGSATAYPTIKIYGPITAPIIDNLEGDDYSFPTLTITAGNYLEIDTRARTILYNSDPADSRRHLLDYTTGSSWWGLGSTQSIRLRGTGTAAPTKAVISWRDAYL